MPEVNDNSWEQTKELMLYRLDDLALQNKLIGASLEGIKSSMNALRIEVLEKTATKHDVDGLRSELHELKLEYTRDISQLKIQAGFWGGIAGVIPIAITLAILVITSFI